MKSVSRFGRQFSTIQPLKGTETVIPKQEILDASQSIKYGVPIQEDLKMGAVSGGIFHQWSNIPAYTRRVIDESQSTSSNSSLLEHADNRSGLSTTFSKALTLIGKGPPDLTLHRGEYFNQNSLVPYKRGSKGAYHWSRLLIPRSVASRCREDLRVEPVNGSKSILLLDRLMDRTSVVYCFSGNEMSGLNTGVKAWKRVLQSSSVDCLSKNPVQVLDIHFDEGWLSRRTYMLTRQILRDFGKSQTNDNSTDDSLSTTFVYRGKWHRDLVLDFHLYNKSLPSTLLIDARGYIRWHAVGLPTDESVETMSSLLSKLVREKQN